MNEILRGAILGFAVGDAVGVPYEFKMKDNFECTDMVGNGTWNQPVGTWSDDTSMVLATMQSIIDKKGQILPRDIMQNFSEWVNMGEFTARNDVFDIGGTTSRAIYRFDMGASTDACGSNDEFSNGNGSLMRILPLAFVTGNFPLIDSVSALTHAHYISKNACRIYVNLARTLIASWKSPGENKIYFDYLIENNYTMANTYGEAFRRIPLIPRLTRDEITSDGYVVDTLESVLWSLYHTDNYKDCILTAVNLGGDTDTCAAIAGGLAGIIYGVDAIPTEWLEKLARKDYIENMCEEFSKVIPHEQ